MGGRPIGSCMNTVFNPVNLHLLRQVSRLHHSALGIMLIQLQELQEEGWVVCRAFQKPTPTQRPCASNVSATYNNSLETTVSMRGNFCDERAVGYSIIPRAEILEGDVVGNDETSAGKKRSNRNGHMMDWKVLDKLLSLSQSNESSTACFLP